MGLFEDVKQEAVSGLALRPVIPIDAGDTVRDVVHKLRAANLGCAVAIDAEGKPQGMFTEAMLRQLVARNPAEVADPITAHLATTFPWVKETDPIETVLEAMEAKNVRFVVVVDESGKAIGLTGQKGLMEYVAERFPGEVMVQRIGTKSAPEEREGA